MYDAGTLHSRVVELHNCGDFYRQVVDIFGLPSHAVVYNFAEGPSLTYQCYGTISEDRCTIDYPVDIDTRCLTKESRSLVGIQQSILSPWSDQNLCKDLEQTMVKFLNAIP